MNNSAFPYGAFLSHRPGWTACERRLLHFHNTQPWAALPPCSCGKHSVRTTTPPGRIFSRDGKGIVQSHRLRERQVGEVLWPIDRLAAAPADGSQTISRIGAGDVQVHKAATRLEGRRWRGGLRVGGRRHRRRRGISAVLQGGGDPCGVWRAVRGLDRHCLSFAVGRECALTWILCQRRVKPSLSAFRPFAAYPGIEIGVAPASRQQKAPILSSVPPPSVLGGQGQEWGAPLSFFRSQIALKARVRKRPGKRRPDTPLAASAAWAGDDKLPGNCKHP